MLDYIDDFKKSFQNDTVAWLLGFALVFSIYSHYKTGDEFSKVCSKVMMINNVYFELDELQYYGEKGILKEALTTCHDNLSDSDSSDGAINMYG